MFSAEDVKVGNGSKYQSAGISESVIVTEVTLNHNEQYNTNSIVLKTINENKQEGLSKRLSLTTEIKAGSTVAAWKITAQYLLNVIMSATGKTLEEARLVLLAKNPNELVKNLERELIGKPFRGLFSSREYQPDKFAIELYSTEPCGGTRLVWDPKNPYYVKRLGYNAPAKTVGLNMGELGGEAAVAKSADDLPF